MIPKRYLIATLFIAAMLLLVAVVQGPRVMSIAGGSAEAPSVLALDSFETLAQTRLQDGWAPRFQGAQDPDQAEPWPFPGGFGAPLEPASAFLGDQGLALYGPLGRSEVQLWRGLEWRRYRFDAPLASARLDPAKGNRLLVTLRLGEGRFETRLLEVPEGRVLWTCDSGPWSRFSWDGRAVLLGLAARPPLEGLLLASLPADGPPAEASLAPWDEKNLPPPPRGWPVKAEQLWEDGRELPGSRLLVPWRGGGRIWFPREDRLWIASGGPWTLWAWEDGIWRRQDAGAGELAAQPPLRMGRIQGEGPRAVRAWSPLDASRWEALPAEEEAWPAYDAAWAWMAPDGALTAWDQRWGKGVAQLPKERQRDALVRIYRPEWRAASKLRASVGGWLPSGPDVALREAQGVAWVWVGDRVLLLRLVETERQRALRAGLRGR